VILGDNDTFMSGSGESISQCGRCASILSKKLVQVTTTTLLPIDLKIGNVILIDEETKKKIEVTPPSEESSTVLPTNKPEIIRPKSKRKMEHIDTFTKPYPSLNIIEDIQSAEPDNYKSSSYRVSDNNKHDYSLNDNFYMNARISHQNKIKPYRSEDDKGDFVFDADGVVLPGEEEPAEDIKSSLYGSTYRNAESKFFGHRIVLRSADEETSTKLIEEVVDISTIKKADPDNDTGVIFDGPLDINSNYTGFIELIGKSIS